MPSWEEVRAYLRAKLPLTADTTDGVELLWDFPVAEAGAARLLQPMRVQPAQAFGAPWLLIMASVYPESFLSLREALLHNQRLAVGVLALAGPFYLMRHTMPLGSLVYAELDLGMHAVAHEAARLRHVASYPPVPVMGAYWSE